MHTVRIWDLPTRLFHWALVLCVVAQVVTAQIGGNWMAWHFRSGYAILTLLLFRLAWGFAGGRWSRFVHFVASPREVIAYLRGRASLPHRAGHNPLGALSVLAMLALLLVQVTSGLFSDDEISAFGPLVPLVSGDTVSWATWYHKRLGKYLLLALIALHLLAIAYHRWIKKESLVPPMLHGNKSLPEPVPAARDDLRSRLGAGLLLLLCGGLVYLLVALGNPA